VTLSVPLHAREVDIPSASHTIDGVGSPAVDLGPVSVDDSDGHERELDRRTDELRAEQFVKIRSRSPS
jgi:hypothetical protein